MFSRISCRCVKNKLGRNISCDFIRSIRSSTINYANHEVKMCKMMKKVMKTGGKRKWFGVSNVQSHVYTVPDTGVADRGRSPISDGQRRRAEHVGTVLYDYIVSLMNSGELHPDIVDSAVEISKVKVVADFSAVNVFWLASGTPTDTQTQELLDRCSGRLRQMLTSLRPIGRIPRINFVQDVSQARIRELDTLLKMADMGPDDDDSAQTDIIQPVVLPNKRSGNLSRQINTDFLKYSLLSVDPESMGSGERISERESDSELCGQKNEQGVDDESSPCTEAVERITEKLNFRDEMYGLERTNLMNKIMLSKNRVKDRNFTFDSSSVESLDFSCDTIPRKPSQLNQKQVLKPQMKPKKSKSFYGIADAVEDDETMLNEMDKSFEETSTRFDNNIENDFVDHDVDDFRK